MRHKLSRAAFIILATLPLLNVQPLMFNSQSQITIEVEKNKAFNESHVIGKFKVESGSIADCLEHCLMNCSCQSFQICQQTECQLCKANKKDNSSLLQTNKDCIYALYKLRRLSHKSSGSQCSTMGCSMKYNCCSKQPGICPKNKICKPINDFEQPWKRFNCECPDGYHGDNCDELIKSCQGYSDGSRKSGIFKINDPGGFYKVYCHLDSYGAWTLVQSYSFENRHAAGGYPLHYDYPFNNDVPRWDTYRLSKAQMNSIQEASDRVLFTCEYEKYNCTEDSDYAELSFKDLGTSFDIIELKEATNYTIPRRGKIGVHNLTHCPVRLHQEYSRYTPLHVDIKDSSNGCPLDSPRNDRDCYTYKYYFYFGRYNIYKFCKDKTHRCVENASSTTQLWFGQEKKHNI